MLDRRRAEGRQSSLVPIEASDAQTSYDALDGMVAQETAIRVRRAVSGLSPMQRDVFTMRVEQGLSYKEIAAILETSEGAARVHYHNAIRAVKEFLDD
jgi:RNA polymerase sigma-70 factor (ECF subfamily)